jgi:hypothetical protein
MPGSIIILSMDRAADPTGGWIFGGVNSLLRMQSRRLEARFTITYAPIIENIGALPRGREYHWTGGW